MVYHKTTFTCTIAKQQRSNQQQQQHQTHGVVSLSLSLTPKSSSSLLQRSSSLVRGSGSWIGLLLLLLVVVEHRMTSNSFNSTGINPMPLLLHVAAFTTIQQHRHHHHPFRPLSFSLSSPGRNLWKKSSANRWDQRPMQQVDNLLRPRLLFSSINERNNLDGENFPPTPDSDLANAIYGGGIQVNPTTISTDPKDPMIQSTTSSSSSAKKLLSFNQQELQYKKPYPRTWVPMGSTYELDPNRPTEIQFLGLSYVVYQSTTTTTTATTSNSDPSSTSTRWVVADNVCPHRLAPLSEGRVFQKQNEPNGTTNTTTTNTLLQCSYHGWSFNENGKCVEMPQADTATANSAFQNPACHVPTYPVIVVKDIIWAWVWPESISEMVASYILAAKSNPTLPPPPKTSSATTESTPAIVEEDDDDDTNAMFGTDWMKKPTSSSSSLSAGEETISNLQNPEIIEQLLGDPNWMLQRVRETNITTYTREMPYGWDTLLENIVDPSHVPFAHHGLQGTRDDAITITMSTMKSTKLLTPPSPPLPQFQTNIISPQFVAKPPPLLERLFVTGFDFVFSDRTMTMKRNCTATFRAPYVIQYEGEFYENATDRTFNLTVLMTPMKPGWSRITIFGPDPADTNKNDDTSTSSTTTVNSNRSWRKSNNTGGITVKQWEEQQAQKKKQKIKEQQEQEKAVRKLQKAAKKKKKKSLFFIIISLLPIWIQHQFSNRFLDSDLAFLHYQEQERQRRKQLLSLQALESESSTDSESAPATITSLPSSTTINGNESDSIDAVVEATTAVDNNRETKKRKLIDHGKYYFVPAQADRSITTFRRWVRDYASYVTDVEVLPPPIYDRDILFNRYIQHTDKCKHCSKAYHETIPKYRTTTYRILGLSIFLGMTIHKLRFLGALGVIGSIFVLRLLKLGEEALTRGDFKHYKR